MYFVSCPKQGLETEAVVLHRVGVLEYFCPKQGQDFSLGGTPIPKNGSSNPPPPPTHDRVVDTQTVLRKPAKLKRALRTEHQN